MNILTGKSSTNIEEKIAKIKPKYYWIVSALLAGLAAYLAFWALGVLGTGKYIVAASDAIAQYAPVLQGFADSVRNGETVWYSFSPELGIGMAFEIMCICWSPFNVLYIILGFVDVETITRIVMILKIMAIAASFTVFAQRVTKTKGPESIFFSLCYAMGGYFFACGFINFDFLDSVIAMPLILTATVNAFETGKKYYLIAVSYAYLFITCFHLGYSIGIFTLLFVIAYLIFKTEDISFGGKLKMFMKWSGCVCVAILLSGVFLLPGILQFTSSGYKDSGIYFNRGVTVFDIINTLFYGTYENYDIENGMLYSGLPVFILTPLFFADKKINLKDKLFLGSLSGVFLLE